MAQAPKYVNTRRCLKRDTGLSFGIFQAILGSKFQMRDPFSLLAPESNWWKELFLEKAKESLNTLNKSQMNSENHDFRGSFTLQQILSVSNVRRLSFGGFHWLEASSLNPHLKFRRSTMLKHMPLAYFLLNH